MSGSDQDQPGGDADGPVKPKVWGRRAYAGKEGRELLNDISRSIARHRPPDVRDPSDPSLADVIRYSDVVHPERRDTDGPKAGTLSELMEHGLTFQEAVCWYWFRWCRFDVTEIHFAQTGNDTGGDPEQRRNSVRNIKRVLAEAASKIPGEDPDDVPGMVDDRKRHDRS